MNKASVLIELLRQAEPYVYQAWRQSAGPEAMKLARLHDKIRRTLAETKEKTHGPR